MVNQNIQVYNSTSNYATGRWRTIRTLSSVDTNLSEGGDATNGNVFAYDYGGSGINVFRPTQTMYIDEPSTTSELSYRTQIAKGTNGGSAVIAFDSKETGKIILMEILD